MGRLKARIRLAGILVLLLGGMFIPIGHGVSPKRDLSAFNNLADMGAFLTWAVALIGIGIVLIVVAVLLPGRFED
jgi:hypothetical protein